MEYVSLSSRQPGVIRVWAIIRQRRPGQSQISVVWFTKISSQYANKLEGGAFKSPGAQQAQQIGACQPDMDA